MNDNDTLAPAPDITDLNRPYWEALKAGHHTFQRCKSCGHAWLPARGECPECLGEAWCWEQAGGQATLISWVVYRFAYHASFAQRLPYTVAVVQLEEGPRMMSNIVAASPDALRIDMPLRMVLENEGPFAVARFTPA